jgi:hypothetical protein
MKAWCEQRNITFTRTRSYHKNDNCYVERKNGDVVRKTVGYARYANEEALASVYRILNPLLNYFYFTGLMNWLDIQGAWTFVLFPGTNGGRYFTINIGPHEVAFSTLKRKSTESIHMILMDKLILDFKDVKNWVKKYKGNIEEEAYDKALPRSVAISFSGNLNSVLELLNGHRFSIPQKSKSVNDGLARVC